MVSTFHGLETAKRGMYAQQAALGVVGHNIANANTPGYSRQRVNFEQTEPYPAPSLNRPQMPGQMGTGVEAGSIQRIRDSFLDVQYRNEHNKLGYWETKANSLMQMEEIMNEPSDSGLANTMDLFWQSIQDLAVNPKNPGARSVVRQRGMALAETFGYLSNSLTDIRQDLGNEIDVTEKEVNSLLEQIHNVNNQIGDVEPHGYLPNDLYDERDRLIDNLSQLVNIKVSYEHAGGNAISISEGKATIQLVDENKSTIADLVNAQGFKEIKVNYTDPDQESYVTSISVGGEDISIENFKSNGKLKGLIESYGMQIQAGEESEVVGGFPEMLAELDNLAFTFAVEFNRVHYAGMGPNEINNTNEAGDLAPTDKKIPFFQDSKNEVPLFKVDEDGNFVMDENGELVVNEDLRRGFARRMEVSDEIRASLDNIANADGAEPAAATTGDATTLNKLADLFSEEFDYGLNSERSNFHNYYEVLIGGMAVDTQNAIRLTENSGTLRQAVEERRMSTSAVSLDEEMTNMIQFQHAYNASARMITLQDELLDKIINGMGTGGR
jgi:flagellar hook-associated protein 1